jgi:hypothetical protein
VTCVCSIAIVASSKSHSFDPKHVNMTHRVHQLSFINPVQEGTHLLQKDKEKMFRSESMNEKWHVSKEGHASIEHYVKVRSPSPTLQPAAVALIPCYRCCMSRTSVPWATVQRSTSTRAPRASSARTRSSFQVTHPLLNCGMQSRFLTLFLEIRVSYDLSPLSVTNSRRRPSFLHFVVQVCGALISTAAGVPRSRPRSCAPLSAASSPC